MSHLSNTLDSLARKSQQLADHEATIASNPLPVEPVADRSYRCCRAGDVPHINMDRLMTGLADASSPPVVLPCKLADGAKLPARGRPDDAGLDLTTPESFFLYPGKTIKVDTEVSMAIPPGHFGHIMGRSGLAEKGIAILGGCVDSGYRGTIGVVLANLGPKMLEFHAGDRIAQVVIQPFTNMSPLVIDTLSTTDRGEEGWGSSGR